MRKMETGSFEDDEMVLYSQDSLPSLHHPAQLGGGFKRI